ncbi:hypothetical protein HXX76_000246 [Chlamydomonas incerta]|uniref:([Pyruvate, phosphate dikinase] phosphate) phosphotransferase n=1 Tax=Chlamydomonas incerta TaxID=51695 RepID=A0A835WE76_CHLIN|nr:hypothetical protein HXX76_000246 [Chlamydomonas incerta]|eukprot:KAG2445636.1 hypothetical protein HXX76_000246 [Chlamydomonas incerta]
MAAFVERTRLEEETMRRKREEVELQLLRMRQQEAVRRQQAIRLRVATERANAAVLAQAGSSSGSPGGSASPSSSAADMSAPPPPGLAAPPAGDGGVGAAGPSGGLAGAAAGPPKKKLVLKRSKRMSAVAAAAGFNRVSPISSQPPLGAATSSSSSSGSSFNASYFAPGTTSPGTSPGTGTSSGSGSRPPSRSGSPSGRGGGSVALLSREDLIQKSKEDQARAALNPQAAEEDGAGGALLRAGGVNDSDCDLAEEVVVPKPVFIISDCTGESAARTVRAALNQFEARCRTQAPAQIMIFRFVEQTDRMMDIIREAAKEDALVVYTLVDPKAVKAVQTACKLQGVRYVDLWSELLDNMEVHLNAVRSGVPATLAETLRKPKAALTDEYFKMIEAVEYTRKMDDGAHPQEWRNADLLILGVSRCGKTPLSIYLGQRGYKVANLPLIPNCPVPKELFEIDQSRVVGLIIDPHVLASIRRNRVSLMGVSRAQSIDYAEVQKINSELEWARKLYNAHPDWPVIDVTLRGIEETAARILKFLNDRRGTTSPQWVDAIHAKSVAPPGAAAGANTAPAQGGATARGPVDGEPAPGTPTSIPELIYGAMSESSFMMQGLY